MNLSPSKNSEIQVMAIINITPDSFFRGSRTTTDTEIKVRIQQSINDGASILDLGGYSTRPGAAEITENEEFERLDRAFGIVKRIAPDFSLSVDTFRSNIVRRLFDKWGNFIVNDISAGELDSEIIPLVGKLGLPYIAMHSRGNPKTMQSLTDYDNFIEEILDFFKTKIKQCSDAGITYLTLDPGFGFAKTVPQNFELLANLNKITRLGYPVLAGLSRKSMIWKTLDTTPDNALNGTSALNWEALRQGATILRVHDIKEALEVVKIFCTFEDSFIHTQKYNLLTQ